jgi:hypothetical protein
MHLRNAWISAHLPDGKRSNGGTLVGRLRKRDASGDGVERGCVLVANAGVARPRRIAVGIQLVGTAF